MRHRYVLFATLGFPRRIDPVDGVVVHVRIEVHPGYESDRVFANESPYLWVVVSSSVVGEAAFGVPLAAGESISVRGPQLEVAERVVSACGRHRTGGVGRLDDAPEPVGME